MKKLIRKDARGEKLKVGDVVRIIGAPDLTGMSEENLLISTPVFQHLVGTYKKIAEFDEHGFAWIRFTIRKGKARDGTLLLLSHIC